MSKALETGKTLAEQILAKLPEAVRSTVAPVFAAPEAVDALTLLGDSGLARADYSRFMDELRVKEEALTNDYTNLNNWFAENKPKLEAYDTLRAENEQLKAGKPAPVAQTPTPAPVQNGFTREDLDRILAERDAGYASVLAVTTTLSAKHYKDFGEVLDMREIVAHATKNRMALYDPRAESDAYRAIHGEKLAAKAKTEEDARIQKLVDERLATERKTQQHPFPVRGVEPSALDMLEQSDRTSRYNADTATARYEELVANSQRAS